MMDACLITFRSVTPAQRGEGALRREGIQCALQRTPKQLADQGCGYSLRIWTNDISGSVAILRRENVQMQRVYMQIPDGTLEEMEL